MSFSASQTALEGFRLIGRRPLSVLAWALVWVVLGYGPLVLLIGGRLPELVQTAAGLGRAARTSPMESFQGVLRFEAEVMTLLAPWLVWIWILGTVLYAAMFRAVLEPRNRGLAYLRLGGDELRLFLLRLVLTVLWTAFLVAAIAAGVGVFIAARALQPPWQVLLDAAVVLVLACALVYLPLRFALAGPMTFAEKRLRIFESWRLTSGHVLKMFGLMLMVFVFILAVSLLASMVRNILLYGLMGSTMFGGTDPTNGLKTLQQWTSLSLQGVGGLLIGLALVQGLIDTVMRLIAIAPFAAAYRALKDETDPSPHPA